MPNATTSGKTSASAAGRVALLLGPRANEPLVSAAIGAAGATPMSVTSVGQLPALLDRLRVPPLCAVVDLEDDAEPMTTLRRDARALDLPVIARVGHPSEREFVRALQFGADDAVAAFDAGGLTRRVASLSSRAAPSVRSSRGAALLADSDGARRVLAGRALRVRGLDVSFAVDRDSLAKRLRTPEGLSVVVVHESLIDDPEGAHGWVRAAAANHTLPVVVLQEPRSDENGGHRVERTGWVSTDAPLDNLLFVVNELLADDRANNRSSPRVLFATLCSFRRASDMSPGFGVTYNVARDGIYVRTLEPPAVGETVWIELRPPREVHAVHLRGTVAWRRPHGDGPPVPPGFGVHLVAQLCPPGDLDRFRASYGAFLTEPSIVATAEPHGTEQPSDRPRVLAADDEEAILRVYRRVFEPHGIAVDVVQDGEQAVRRYRAARYDAVLTDIHMPGLNGIELLKAIRAHDDQVPVIITTGEPSTDTAIEALDHGAVRYLVKPVSNQDLLAAVQQALGMGRLAKFRREAARIVAETGGPELGHRERLGASFERALGALRMHYQPIVSLAERRIVAFEALVRSGEPSLPHPGALFDAAEALDRLPDLSRAIRSHVADPMEGREETLFVNLHPEDLLDETLYAPHAPLTLLAPRTVLEITERASLDGVVGLRDRIARLRDLGFRIAVDDLGAGYAGLAAFCALSPDVAKMDMSLVRDVHEVPTKQRLVRSLVEACGDLGIVLVAEGVETRAELETLQSLGCDRFQGYLLARPALPFPEVTWPS